MKRFLTWLAGFLLLTVAALFGASFFLDPIVRTGVERRMNEKLVGYRTYLGHAHLQLLSGTLTLSDLRVMQLLYPKPAVANIPEMDISIEWHDLLLGRVVAKLAIYKPAFNVNLPQLHAVSTAKVPLKNAGWQEAIENVYPFKIDNFDIVDGNFTYIDNDPQRPLKMEHLNLTADNIRNIRAPRDPFPSPVQIDATVFETGRVTIKGRANFLTVPTASCNVDFRYHDIPLSELDQVARRANLAVHAGEFEGAGSAKYTPKIEDVDLRETTLTGLKAEYFHRATTAQAESKRLTTVRKTAQEVENKPQVRMRIREFNVVRGELTFNSDAAKQPYSLDVSDINARVRNLGSRSDQGAAAFDATGRVMNSGTLKATGSFKPEAKTADFDLNAALENIDLPSLNKLLLAYGRFDVQAGMVSVYTSDHVHNGYLRGYVKPMFSNVEVYRRQKDQGKPILHQAYEAAIGAAAKLFKNRSTNQVATEVDISGKLSEPNSSTWQAFVRLLSNAFVKAILPGFDRQVGSQANQNRNTAESR
jgi:Domain of Unknown Function (DUF748)